MLNGLKRKIIDISYQNKLSHIGSNLSAVGIIDEIYSIKKPDEKFALSCGHMNLALQVVLKERGLIEEISLETHPDITQKGVDCSTGSLGHGLPIAVGMALADRSKNVYCLISDGECAEGSIWEAVRIAGEQKLDNLKIYVNANGFSAYKETNVAQIKKLFKALEVPVKIVKTSVAPLKGILAHYQVLTKEEYEKIIL